jgi:hypothetical protein
MDKIVDFYEKHRKKLLVLLILINIISLIGVFRIRFNTDFTLFMPKNSKYEDILNEIEKDFSSKDQLNLLIEFNVSPYSLEGIKKIREYENRLKKIDGVVEIVSPLPTQIPVGFRKVDVSQINESNIDYVLNFLKKISSENIIEKDGKYYLMFYIFPNKRVVSEINKVIDVPHYFAGTSYLQEKIFDYLLFIVLTIPPLAILTIFFVFKWRLGSRKATFFSVFPAGMGALWTMGFIGWYKGEISVLSILAPIFTIVMGSADGLHFVSHFMDIKKVESDNKKALSKALESTGIAMILTTITTVVGFLSLIYVNSDSLAEVAFFSSLGISFAAVATWLFLPIILLNAKLKIKEDKSKIGMFLENLIGKKSILVSILLALIFAPGAFFLNSEFYMIDMYKNTTQVKKNIDKVSEIAGISVPVFGYFKAEKIVSPEIANQVLQFEEKIREKDIKAVSVYDLMKNINEKILGREGYPPNIVQAGLLLNLMPDVYSNFLNIKTSSGRILIFPKEISKQTLNYIEKSAPSFVKITGIPYIMKEMNEIIVPQQIVSLILAVIFVFIIVLIRIKNLKEALISILPISLTLIVLFGFMGYFNVKLNIITATMGSIVVGVGIDYAIHFIESYNYNYKKFKNKKQALDEAFRVTSKPILANALGLAIGLSVLLVSPFKIHEYLIGIMWVSMISSSLFSLTLLPSLLFLAKVEKNRV